MKKKFVSFAILTSLFLTLLAFSALAQSSQLLTVTVPFDFTVDKTTLPAGTYTIERTSANMTEVFSISDADRQTKAVFTTHIVESDDAPAQARLAFRRYGDQYFLGQVWAGHDGIGHELTPSSQERELAKNDKAPAEPKNGKIEIRVSGR